MIVKSKNISLKFIESKLFKWIFFGFALIFTFGRTLFGIDFTDSFYYLNLIKYYSNNSLISGTLYVGYIVKYFIGNELLAFRLFSTILMLFAIFIPFFTLFESKRRFEILNLISFSIIATSKSAWGADTLTIIFLRY